MSTILGRWSQGRVRLDDQVDWPEGTVLRIEPCDEDGSWGMREEDWPTTPEGIAALVAEIDAVEPLEMTDEEIANWEAARREQMQWELEHFEEHAESLRKMWE